MGNEKLFVSWEELEELNKKLVKKIKRNDYNPNAVIGISRGGLPISVRVSHLLELPMGMIEADHYRGDGYGTQQDKAVIKGTLFGKKIKGNILLVDDIIDTGKTMEAVIEELNQIKEIEEIKTGVIHEKPHSCMKPDFCAYPTPVDKWVVYPFEKMSPGD
ncbi:hypothetical protein C9439_07000 [archaeon SCG-AAA382B04]|nr:hypothetical protein C9439_07000 [archaeon SCG-AAA382B04]